MKKTVKTIIFTLMVLSFAAAIILAAIGTVRIFRIDGVYSFVGEVEMHIQSDGEDHSDERYVDASYVSDDGRYEMTVRLQYENWETAVSGSSAAENGIVTGYIYENEDGSYVVTSEKTSGDGAAKAVREKNIGRQSPLLSAAMAVFLVGAGLAVIGFFYDSFTAYEKIWFISVIVLASVFSIIFPEESANGVNGIVIMALYLADTVLNVLCELLISKQSKWNFIVSVFVEITEILMCIVLAYRFATLAVTLFFWLPIDIISFISWHKHPDKDDEEITEVRSLTGWQEALVLLGIAVWTVGIGYLLTTLDLGGDFIRNRTLETVICYFDACVSAVGIANGVFILLRLREQWIAWYASALLETAINVMSGQYVLLVLKAGYLTNTTYGFIKWTKYIKAHKKEISE